jgi:hypothetical protein
MKATKATVRARVDDILRVILDGAEPWQIGPYVAEQEQAGAAPWTVPEGGKPLSRRQIRRYVSWAERLLAASCRTDRDKLLRKHAAQRRNLYARALNSGQLNVALAVLRDLAELQGLYPSADDELRREAEALRKQLAELMEAKREGGNGQAAEGTGGPAERGEGGPQPHPPG